MASILNYLMTTTGLRTDIILTSITNYNSYSILVSRFFSDQGCVLEDEERARENLYVKKMEKQKPEAKEKTDKEKADEKVIYIYYRSNSLIFNH
ncbi:hypothetical protein HanRHA438_Chr14g0671631 [Helianthus annuus]|nr:hypothetical protein HanRHA438_Chr14g0671591 [Helianthus annuus]KAJ0855277.1 hypothetical protein HanRHA438_Chr14g0671631 [Helianthus annuus]